MFIGAYVKSFSMLDQAEIRQKLVCQLSRDMEWLTLEEKRYRVYKGDHSYGRNPFDEVVEPDVTHYRSAGDPDMRQHRQVWHAPFLSSVAVA